MLAKGNVIPSREGPFPSLLPAILSPFPPALQTFPMTTITFFFLVFLAPDTYFFLLLKDKAHVWSKWQSVFQAPNYCLLIPKGCSFRNSTSVRVFCTRSSSLQIVLAAHSSLAETSVPTHCFKCRESGLSKKRLSVITDSKRRYALCKDKGPLADCQMVFHFNKKSVFSHFQFTKRPSTGSHMEHWCTQAAGQKDHIDYQTGYQTTTSAGYQRSLFPEQLLRSCLRKNI